MPFYGSDTLKTKSKQTQKFDCITTAAATTAHT